MITIKLPKKSLFLGLLPLAFILMGAGSCDNQATYNDKQATNRQLEQYQKSQPIPFYTWSRPRDSVIQIYNLQNQAVDTWSAWFTLGGDAIDSCPSIGYPIPGDTQLTNPDQVVDGSTIGQMEPNGLYSSKSTNSTWVLCIRPNGDVEATYVEPLVVTYGHAIKVVDKRVVDVSNGVSTTKITVDQPPTPVP